MELMSVFLWESRACFRRFAGLTATRTAPARLVSSAITIKSSIKVNACFLFGLFGGFLCDTLQYTTIVEDGKQSLIHFVFLVRLPKFWVCGSVVRSPS